MKKKQRSLEEIFEEFHAWELDHIYKALKARKIHLKERMSMVRYEGGRREYKRNVKEVYSLISAIDNMEGNVHSKKKEVEEENVMTLDKIFGCLLYTSPSPRD